MTRLKYIIEQLCPDGVEYKTLGEIATISRGGSFQKKHFVDSGVPCIHYGQIYTRYGLFAHEALTYISYEVAEKQRFAQPNDIVMAVTSENIEDVCKCVVWLGDTSVAVSGHSAIIHHSQNAKFLAYYFHSSMFFAQKRKIAQGTKVIEVSPEKLNRVTIPIPPLEVQAEIVRILDKFTELTTELTTKLATELTNRKKQYEYYRDNLLELNSEVEHIGLRKIAEFKTGSKPDIVFETKEQGDFEYINAGTTNSGYVTEYNCEGDTVTTPSRGQGGIGFVGYHSKAFWLGPLCYKIRGKDSEKINNKYLYYCLSKQRNDIISRKKEGGVPALNASDLATITIPVPSLQIQNRIVNVLDNFESICSDLNIGLPAEIEARQKQYEYYRDKLLSFKNIDD